MRSIKDINFYNSRVFVRADLNVPIKDDKVVDDFKIQKTLETLRYLKHGGAKIILASHMTMHKKKKNSLKPVHAHLEKLLDDKISFSKKITGIKGKTKRMRPGKIIMLENLRLEKGENRNDKKFAKALANLADSYVGEAFPETHREVASMVLLPKLLPHFAGFQMEKEVDALSKISQNPKRPLCVIIGGIKIESKMKAVERFLNFTDHLILGGKIADNIFRVKGQNIGKPWPDEDIVRIIEKINLTDPKIHMPIDALVSPDSSGDVYVREAGIANVRKDEGNYDIGQETIEFFSEVIRQSKTVFWSGPLGLYENERFEKGTRKIAKAIAEHSGFTVAGGGDTVAALRKYNVLHRFSFVSTGGGAMLAFLAGDDMPGINALI